MVSGLLLEVFEERLQEITDYLAFLDLVQQQVQAGAPRVGDSDVPITATQQKILCSSVYLQLYNLVEATITRCIEAVSEAAMGEGRWKPHDLSAILRREWVRHTARTHDELNVDNRLTSAVAMCEQVIQSMPINDFQIEKGGGGNWDDNEIENFVRARLGLTLNIAGPIYTDIKRHVCNDKGTMEWIKSRRNDLAHGSLSFAECGANTTVSELRLLADRTANYLREVVVQVSEFIDASEFLIANSRPPQSQ